MAIDLNRFELIEDDNYILKRGDYYTVRILTNELSPITNSDGLTVHEFRARKVNVGFKAANIKCYKLRPTPPKFECDRPFPYGY